MNNKLFNNIILTIVSFGSICFAPSPGCMIEVAGCTGACYTFLRYSADYWARYSARMDHERMVGQMLEDTRETNWNLPHAQALKDNLRREIDKKLARDGVDAEIDEEFIRQYQYVMPRSEIDDIIDARRALAEFRSQHAAGPRIPAPAPTDDQIWITQLPHKKYNTHFAVQKNDLSIEALRLAIRDFLFFPFESREDQDDLIHDTLQQFNTHLLRDEIMWIFIQEIEVADRKGCFCRPSITQLLMDHKARLQKKYAG